MSLYDSIINRASFRNGPAIGYLSRRASPSKRRKHRNAEICGCADVTSITRFRIRKRIDSESDPRSAAIDRAIYDRWDGVRVVSSMLELCRGANARYSSSSFLRAFYFHRRLFWSGTLLRIERPLLTLKFVAYRRIRHFASVFSSRSQPYGHITESARLFSTGIHYSRRARRKSLRVRRGLSGASGNSRARAQSTAAQFDEISVSP